MLVGSSHDEILKCLQKLHNIPLQVRCGGHDHLRDHTDEKSLSRGGPLDDDPRSWRGWSHIFGEEKNTQRIISPIFFLLNV